MDNYCCVNTVGILSSSHNVTMVSGDPGEVTVEDGRSARNYPGPYCQSLQEEKKIWCSYNLLYINFYKLLGAKNIN